MDVESTNDSDFLALYEVSGSVGGAIDDVILEVENPEKCTEVRFEYLYLESLSFLRWVLTCSLCDDYSTRPSWRFGAARLVFS